ncbi:EamA family transporter [Chitinophaga sedimenti]|uniref:EamA family transporter n=1 Tax=Chitinophaga sedimenti TaxID=2033606 RepID=UPI002005B539|nr:EamA family transporter [Chitinophaga sedimenti]MCK7555059.1 EamA family transporter [Chitinophaga sedimenti]
MNTPDNTSRQRSTMLVTCLIAVYIIWGSTYLGMKVATEIVPPFLLSAFRFFTAGMIMFVIGMVKEKEWPSGKQWASASLVGVLLIGVGNGGVALAVHYMPSGLVALLVAAAPAYFVAQDWLFFSKQRPAAMTLWGILIGFIGLFFIFNPFRGGAQFDFPKWPLFVVIAGSICWTLGSLLVQRLPMPRQLTSTAIQMLSGCIFTIVMSVCLERDDWSALANVNLRTWIAFLHLVFLGSLVGYTSYSWLTKNAPPRITSTYAYVNPVVALFLGWLVLDEMLNPDGIIGSVIVILGVVLMTRKKK